METNNVVKVDIHDLSEFISIINKTVEEKNLENKFSRYETLHNHIGKLQSNIELLEHELPEIEYNDIKLYKYTRDLSNIKTELSYWLQLLKHSNNSILDNELLEKTNFSRYKFFYRGHYNEALYRLLPSVFRNTEPYKEDFYYHNIKVQCSDDFVNCNHIHQLVQMQHYDCPTRLLDITSNPLVALFFACKNFGCKNCNQSNIGEVFVFAVRESEILYYDSDKALMLSCLPRFSHADKMEIYDACYKKIIQHKIFDSPNNGTVIERLYHEIRTEVPSFEKKMNPIDLLSPFFVQPLKMNARILKQDGAFIINGLSKRPEDATKKLEYLVTTRIRVHNQDYILKELDKLGINEASLFPEVDKVANYLKDK